MIAEEETPRTNFEFRTAPYEKQLEAWRLSRDREYFALLMDMGTGKSKVTVDTAAWLHHTDQIDCMMIAVAKSIYREWDLRQIPTHMPDQITYRMYVWGTHSGALDRELQSWICTKAPGRLRIVVINIEALSSMNGRAHQFCERFLKSGRALFVVDESTDIKNPDSNRTKTVTKLAQYAEFRRILTGLPVTNNPLDVYSQFNFLHPSIMGMQNFFHYKRRYTVQETQFFGDRRINLTTGFRNLDELREKIQPHSIRILADEMNDLPEKIYLTRTVEMTPEQSRIYNSLRQDAMAVLDSGQYVSSTMGVVTFLRMYQCLLGYVVTEDEEKVPIPSNRIPRIIEELHHIGDEKVCVWAPFRQMLQQLVDEIAKNWGSASIVEYHGGVTPKQREVSKTEFQEGTPRFFCATPQAGGKGLTLTAGTMNVYGGNTAKLDDRLQSEKRTHRIGQTRGVRYLDFYVEGTIEDTLLDKLRNKIDMATLITGDPRMTWLR